MIKEDQKQSKITIAFQDFYEWNEEKTPNIYKNHLARYLFMLVKDFKENQDQDKLQQDFDEIRLLWNMFNEME